MKKKSPTTLRQKFLKITIALMLVLGFATSTLSYIMFSNNLKSNSIHAAETNLQSLRNDINGNLESVIELSKWSQTNTDILNYLSSNSNSYEALTKQATERLSEEYISNPASKYISRIIIANLTNKKFLQRIANSSYSIDRNVVEVIENLPYYNQLITASDYTFSIGIQEDPFMASPEKMFPMIRSILHPYNNTAIGISYIQISLSLFTNPLIEFSRQVQLPVYLTIENETYEIHGNTMKHIEQIPNMIDIKHDTLLRQDTFVQKISSEFFSSIYVSSPLNIDNCYITIPISADIQENFVTGYLAIFLFIVLFVIIIGLLLMTLLSKNVAKPVEMLKKQIDSIASGNFSQNPSIEWDNELGDIGHNINQLAIDINNLIEQRIAYEKQKKDYEYQMLQSQINPHFLYNTLNSIKWMAVAQHADGISEMTTALAHLLKNVSKRTTTIISIREELHLLDDYFIIQKYRYGGNITMEYHIEEETLLDNQILRFTLQPIVENAIFHGIEPKGQTGHIDIHIYSCCNNNIQIDIQDNGIGMDQKTIDSVLSDDSFSRSSFFKQIGISVVNKRIQYNFGEGYGMHIKSIPGEYTCMSILLPALKQITKE